VRRLARNGEGDGKTVMAIAQPTNGYYCRSRETGKIDEPRFVREVMTRNFQ